jgi:hypothetical protein
MEEREYLKKMKEMDEFQDLLYSNKNTTNRRLLPNRALPRREREAQQTEAQKRLAEIDAELNSFLEKKLEDRENSADI